jgi:hypothetical protein
MCITGKDFGPVLLTVKAGSVVAADRPVSYMRGWKLRRVIALADRWHWKINLNDDERTQRDQQQLQGMLDEVAPKLKIGVHMLSETVRADAREGDIGMQLGEIAKANPGVAIGSYPFFDPQHGPHTNVVLRARDAHKLALAKRAVEDMLERVRRAQSSS